MSKSKHAAEGEPAEVVGRIAAALKRSGIPRGYRGPQGELAHVELQALDILDACALVQEPDQVVKDLLQGSSRGKRERMVVIQMDDAYHLVEAAGGKKGAEGQ